MKIDQEIAAAAGIEIEAVIRVRRELARMMGRAGGLKKSERKTAAVRLNGKLGGRPSRVLLTPKDLKNL